MNSAENGEAAKAPKKWTGTLWQWIGVSLGVCLLYVLSVGPAVRLSEDGWLSKTGVNKLYRPLGIIRGTPMEKLLNIYVRFWLPPPQQVDVPFNREF